MYLLDKVKYPYVTQNCKICNIVEIENTALFNNPYRKAYYKHTT